MAQAAQMPARGQALAGRSLSDFIGGGRGLLGRLLLRSGVLVAFGVAWQLVTARVDSFFFPTATEIVGRFWQAWGPGAGANWLQQGVPSLLRLAAGWVVAVGIGVVVGVAVGLVRQVRDYVDPVIHFARAIPPPALIPLFLVLLGIGDGMKVALIAFGVVWPIMLNTIDGVRAVDPLHLETARIYGIDRRRRLTHIVLPAAAPRIFAGLRISLSLAIILMVISEMVATTNGIGFRIVQAQRSFRMLDMWAGILLLSLLGWTLNTAFAAVEGRVLAWHRGARRTAA